jgi:hypothetical protein
VDVRQDNLQHCMLWYLEERRSMMANELAGMCLDPQLEAKPPLEGKPLQEAKTLVGATRDTPKHSHPHQGSILDGKVFWQTFGAPLGLVDMHLHLQPKHVPHCTTPPLAHKAEPWLLPCCYFPLVGSR